ncbi:efflux RND transporter periplasmic adaptor subunit [Aeromonas simiae]|uniref:Efflux RND transporter periplasmic adaptor subunit n=1 Tax=Aeromonas simiae TaxID=218936 RepID=A0A5J6WR63_9GAMM|nr:efflux RND transporter periplasmic adaptor subunit [Aeromonas simiae]QFI53599.1 efflux RND transporter periplasmic adaptor subunit [Aeromonas simiae]
MPRLHPRLLWWLLPLFALFIWFAFGRQGDAESGAQYITASAERRDLEQSVLADGTLEARKQVSVGAQVSGQIKALHVALGDKVKAGDLLAEIDDLTQQNSLKDAEAQRTNLDAQIAAKQAALRNAELTFTRQQNLLARRLVSQADYDTAKATLDQTRAEIRALQAQRVQAEIALDTARVNLGYTQIRAPLDGTVVAIPVEVGQTVNAVQSAPTLMKIAQLDTMTVEAQISEADVIKAKVGMPVYFTILGAPETRNEATLRAIEPAPDSINSDTSSSSTSSTSTSSSAIYYNGLFDVPNPDGVLRISMTAQVYLVLDRVSQALVIPAPALQGDQVQVVDEQGRVSVRRVKVGLNNKVHAQILEGLKEGEKVIVSTTGEGASSASRPRMRGPMGF